MFFIFCLKEIAIYHLKLKKKTTANIQRNIGLLGTIGDASENQEWRSQSTEWKEQAYKLTTWWKLKTNKPHNVQRNLSKLFHIVLTPNTGCQSSPFVNTPCTLQVIILQVVSLCWAAARFFYKNEPFWFPSKKKVQGCSLTSSTKQSWFLKDVSLQLPHRPQDESCLSLSHQGTLLDLSPTAGFCRAWNMGC